MGWVKDGARAYRDGDKRLIKHTRTFNLELAAAKLILKSELDWQRPGDNNHPNVVMPNERLQLKPGAPKSTRLIEATGELMNGDRIKVIESEGRDWSAVDVSLYRAAEDLKTVDLTEPDIEIQPQVLWHNAGGDSPKRPPALLLVITLPAQTFDLFEEHLRSKAPGAVSMVVSIDVYENPETPQWMSAFGNHPLYIASGSSNAALFEKLRIAPPAAAVSTAARDRLVEAADEAIAEHIKEYCEEWKIEDSGHSQTERILDALCRAAAEVDARNGVSAEDFKKRTFRVMVGLVNGLREAVTPYSERETGKLDFWKRERQPFFEIRRDQKAPQIDRVELEGMADRYLRLPYRCAEFDRLLADMLTAAEMYAYGETVLIKNPVAWVFGLSASPIHPRPIRNWLIGQAWNLLFFGVPAGISWWMASKQWIDDGTALWVTLGCGGIFLLLFGISIVALPFFIYRSARVKANILNRLDAMQSAYAAIGVSGPISARHVTQRLEVAADRDVVWPGALYVLLDDIIARGGRF
ncbi:MAG TPA: hypothetical protein VFE34_14430 [Dongiaceae bacterium]|jgi:hypothetical protein|nr:hypothetical protein [Dongiaceae bacterium]